MSFEMQEAFRFIETDSKSKHVADWLAWHHNIKSKRCDPSIATLVAETRMSERSVYRALKKLEEEGHIRIVSSHGQRNFYILHPVQPVVPLSPCQGLEANNDGGPLSQCHPTPVTLSPLPLSPCQGTPVTLSPEQETTGSLKGIQPEFYPSASSAMPIPAERGKPSRVPKEAVNVSPTVKEVIQRMPEIHDREKPYPFVMDKAKASRTLERFFASNPQVDAEHFLEVWELVCRHSASQYSPSLHKAFDIGYLCRNFAAVRGSGEHAFFSTETKTKKK